jgi:hypothetical protein
MRQLNATGSKYFMQLKTKSLVTLFSGSPQTPGHATTLPIWAKWFDWMGKMAECVGLCPLFNT